MKAIFPMMFKVLVLICCTTSLSGQGWLKQYPDDFGGTAGLDAKPTADGGFILLSETDFPTGAIRRYIRLTKTDAQGAPEWEKTYNEGDIQDVQAADVWPVDGGYAVGYSQNGVLSFMLTDQFGDTLLTRQYPEVITSNCFAMHPTPDGGFVMGGIYTPDFSPSSATILKLSAQGDLLWWKDLPGTASIHNAYNGEWDLKPTADGGYIATGSLGSELTWFKLDANADLLWSKTLQLSTATNGYSVIETSSGGFLIGASADGFAGPSPVLIRTDAQGEVVWQQFLQPGIGFVADLIEGADGSFIAVGSLGSFYNNYGFPFVSKYDDSGQEIWSSGLSQDSVNRRSFASVYPDGDGFILAGAEGFEAIMARIDGQGRYYPHLLQGRVALDEDCAIDNQSLPLAGLLVEIKKGNNTLYATTDAAGYYEAGVDTGQYQLTALLPGPYYGSCQGTAAIAVNTIDDSTAVDFPIDILQECPYLTVDISTGFLRRCFESSYTVFYRNTGTVAAEGAEVRIVLDPYLSIQGASLSYQVEGDTLVFAIGALDVNDQGYFTVTVLVDCDNTVLGQTHCTSAVIRSANECPLPDNDTPSVTVEGECSGENVVFRLSNPGPGAIQEAQFIVIEDDVMLAPTPYSLGEGQEKTYEYPANGSTWRLETPLFPEAFDGQFVSAVIEGCGTNSSGVFSTGFVNQFSLDDPSPATDTDCRPNIGSYDPNDKQAFPEGYQAENKIYRNTPIEYLIRFQNTGTDTAFRVVVIDTLSQYLDPASIRPGASSHPYEFELYGTGIAKFTFYPIFLPDSSKNEAASNGFVKFTITQRADLPIGTKIENLAGIYFDFNAPVLTNTTFHTVGKYLGDPTGKPDPAPVAANLRIVPNPVSGAASLSVEGVFISEGQLALYDGAGRLVAVQPVRDNRITLNVRHLPGGLYFFRIRTEEGWIGSGKVVIGKM